MPSQNKIASWYRQGDVTITSSQEENIPNGMNKLSTKTLAYGEITGHHHTVTAGQVLLFGPDEMHPQYMEVQSESATLTHQEHNPITLPKGVYNITNENTFDYFTESVKRVVD